MRSPVIRSVAFGASLLIALLLTPTARGQQTGPGEGADLAFGSVGSGPGQFLELRDITFSPKGLLYALDGAKRNNKTKQIEGNLRVQVFERTGKLISAFDLSDAATGHALGELNDPQRLAIASDNVFITQPAAGKVWQFDASGKFIRAIDVPGATAVCTWREAGGNRDLVAVVGGGLGRVVKRKPIVAGGEQISLVNDRGEIARQIELSQPMTGVMDIAADRAGHFYIKADPNGVYEFSADGKLLKTLGGNPTTRAEDGSELLHTVAVDSRGNVYSMTWGNPGLVTCFAADGQTLSQRGGQWKFADPWSVHSSYVALAIDPDDRLWVAVTNRQNPQGVNYKKYHASPAILRTKADFLSPTAGARTTPTRLPGFRGALACDLPYNVSYQPGEAVPMEYAVAAANRSVDRVTVQWRAFDAEKHDAGSGRFELPLVNGREARQAFQFTPKRYGGYLVIARALSEKGDMGAVGEHVAVTPRYPKMDMLPGQSKGGWNDITRQIWTGLPNVRIHPGTKDKTLLKTDEEITAAEKAKITYIVQLVGRMKDLTPEFVRKIATRYKGRVPMYEICNEPNFSSKPDEYFAGHKMAYQIIKEIDPQAKVMGPATVNMNLDWFNRLYELGLKDITDAISTHDYEGHESIDPVHWRWKLGEIRKIMAAHGDAEKPIWQTERAIAGVRGQNYEGLVQAIRCTLHRDLLETLGIASAHNFHYYLNQAGYSAVPSYLWSSNGPHPGAVALRTRYALTAGKGRAFTGTLDFGPTGNTFLQGIRYADKDGAATIVLRNLGCEDRAVAFTTNAKNLTVTDAWGNASTVAVENGKATIPLRQLPTYVDLAAGQQMTAEQIDFGRNVANQAKWEYSAAIEKGDPSVPPPPARPGVPPPPLADPGAPHPLANGIYETFHSQDPNGDANGQKIWTGALPLDENGKIIPQTLTATFPTPQRIDKLIVRTVRADNTFCTLLAYDVQIPDGDGWRTIDSVNHQIPPSEAAKTADARTAIWMDDTNLHVHCFDKPVTTTKLRLLVRRTTYGFVPDTAASAWGKTIPPKLMLREVEIYAK